MMSKLLNGLTILFTSLLAILATMIWSFFITLAGLVKLCIPIKAVSVWATTFANSMMWCWCLSLAAILRITNPNIIWDIEGIDGLSKENWYLLISNHKSWADVVVLCVIFCNQIPMNKYFLKHQLLWVPFVGLACCALDMPFMKRYSRAFLLKNPHLRGQDIETTRKSCEKFRLRPTTVVNFVEGSRFTEQKQISTRSPYKNLLLPKAAGIAFTLNALGKQFDKLLNVTLFYPDNIDNPFLSILSGKMKRIVVRVETRPITDDIRGDYFNNKNYKRQFQLWLNDVWQQKDQLLEKLKDRYLIR